MVAARELAAQGQSVVMLGDGKRPGAHFTGMRVENHDFDIGMVLFEQVQRGEQALDVDSYNPEQRNDSARFARLSATTSHNCGNGPGADAVGLSGRPASP